MTSRSPLLWLFIACVSLALANPHSHAEQTFFKPGDVIALLGGEDMVSAAEYGYLETYITRALPDHRLKFRSLAWEGDTVFEQRRDLNYPTIEQQLDKIGATVVIVHFGQMESFAGKEKVGEFMAAYEKMVSRLENGEKRRVLVLTPSNQKTWEPITAGSAAFLTAPPKLKPLREDLAAYRVAIVNRGTDSGSKSPGAWNVLDLNLEEDNTQLHRDGVHLNERGHSLLGWYVARHFLGGTVTNAIGNEREQLDQLRGLVRAKNRLWFHYYRPQNWAFLAGDRTNQPSSRDHLDQNKRWFPEELEQFLPLIEQKEAEIHQLAATLAKP